MTAFKRQVNNILDNLASLDGYTGRLDEARFEHLRELALMLTRENEHPGSPGETLEFLRSRVRGFEAAALLRSSFTFREKSLLSALIYENTLGALPPELALSAFFDRSTAQLPHDAQDSQDFQLPHRAADSRISGLTAYIQNRFTDAAFSYFSTVVRHAGAAYFDSFSAVCEEVFYNRCEFCILPLERSRDGMLPVFYSMLVKYELKIILICRVADNNGDSTVYALLGKNIVPPAGKPSILLEAAFIQSDVPLHELLCAAGMLGLLPKRINSLPLTYSDSEYSHFCVFSLAEDAQPGAFLTYLELFSPQYTAIGLYPEHLTST